MSNTEQLSAIDRITSLLDNGSFTEVGAYVTKRNTDFNLSQKEIPADGVITGYGTINGNLVYIYSQDGSALGGSIGEMHAKKITNIYDLALKVGAPVIGLINSSGFRLQEGTDALNSFGNIYMKQTYASGIIPQIAAIYGTCGGGLAVMGALSDFLFMEKNNAKLYINSPNAILGNHKEKNNTAESGFHGKAGTVDYVCADEYDMIDKIRELVTILPSNNGDEKYTEEGVDDLNRLLPAFNTVKNDTKRALTDISDNNFFFEIKPDYAMDMVTGFIRLNGMTIGAVANRSNVIDDEGNITKKLDDSLSSNGCIKASKFVNFCDAFNIPLITLTNVNGYKASMEDEKSIAKSVAALTYAFANASVPKVNLIIGKAFGSAYISMNSKHIGADMVFALPDAKIGMMDSNLAAHIMYDGETTELINQKAKEYDVLQSSAQAAAKRGYVDSIIQPEEVRKHIIYSFEMLYSKNESRPAKKHGSL